MTESIYDMACYILRETSDGNKLDSQDLYLVQEMVNGNLTEAGEVEFYKIHERVKNGYVKPWFHGIEHLTQDHIGYVYWKGKSIEHYSFRDYEEETRQAHKLAQNCMDIEARGEEVNTKNLFKEWDIQRG